MNLNGGLFWISLLCCVIISENKGRKEVKIQDLMNIFDYIRNYSSDRSSNVQLPIFLLPVLIVSPQRKDFVSKESLSSENTKGKVKSSQTKNDLSDLDEESSDIKVNFRQALNRGNGTSQDDLPNGQSHNSSSKRTDSLDNKITKEDIFVTEQTALPRNTAPNNLMDYQTTTNEPTITDSNGAYPTPVYNNTDIKALTFTDSSVDTIQQLPTFNDKWIKFTRANLSFSDNTSTSLDTNVTETNSNKNPYPSPLYNNSIIDTLSITTNSYTNEESPLLPPQDDRWGSFSSLGEISITTPTGFMPLAGLYYDGYLHTPLSKAPGFIPYL